VLLTWSDAAGRVLTKTLPVVTVMTLVTVLLVVDRICYRHCFQHCLELLDMHIDFFIILGEMGVILSTSILEAKALWASMR
jgi:hypothetical protein